MNHKLLLLICIIACAVGYAQPAKIYLSPKAAGGARQSIFIDSLKLYPLEDYSGISPGQYNSLIISAKYFIVESYLDKELSIYSKDGKYIKKVSYKKLGREANPEYDRAKEQLIFFHTNKNYTLNEKDIIQIRANFAAEKNKKYYKKYIIDLKDSSFTIQKSTPAAFDILNAYNLKDDYYCTHEISVNKNYKDTIDYEVKIYKDTKFVNGYFPYHKQNEIRYMFGQNIDTYTQGTNVPDVYYITRPYVDTIYSLSNGIITPVYKLVLPMENSLPKSFFETPFKNKTERENFQRNNGRLLRQIYTVFESARYAFFSIGFFNNYGQYMYDKKTNGSYNLSKVKPDSVNYYLPLLTQNFGNHYGNKFYSLVTPEQLKIVYEQNKDRIDRLPKELQYCLKDSTNPKPLIAEYSIKNN